MAGHSKWATTKRHKAAIDAKRGKIFSSLSKDITVAARSGGGDLNFNPRLRTLILKAKAANMPADNIDRAVKKGTGELPGVEYFSLVYEAYAPGGVAIVITVTTDNKNRAAGDVRSTLSKFGGNLATTGAVTRNFLHAGQFIVSAEKASEEKLMEVCLEAGADDIVGHGDHFEVRCPLGAYDAVSSALEKAGIACESSEIAYIPTIHTAIADKDAAQRVIKITEALDELEDVQAVFDNSQIDESLLG